MQLVDGLPRSNLAHQPGLQCLWVAKLESEHPGMVACMAYCKSAAALNLPGSEAADGIHTEGNIFFDLPWTFFCRSLLRHFSLPFSQRA